MYQPGPLGQAVELLVKPPLVGTIATDATGC